MHKHNITEIRRARRLSKMSILYYPPLNPPSLVPLSCLREGKGSFCSTESYEAPFWGLGAKTRLFR
jgi:hypothetical protein